MAESGETASGSSVLPDAVVSSTDRADHLNVMMQRLAEALAGAVPSGLDDQALVDLVGDWERLVSWAQAGQLAAIAELARRRPADPGRPGDGSGVSEFAVDEVAAALHLSRLAAGHRLHVAVELAERLPVTAAALAAGDIDLPKARAVVDAATPLDAPTAAAIEVAVLPAAAEQTVGQLRSKLSRAVLRAGPAAAAARHEKLVADRRVELRPLLDGMAELWALLPADAATAAYTAIDNAAHHGPADDRPIDARRADALVDLLTRRNAAGGASPADPAAGGDTKPRKASRPGRAGRAGNEPTEASGRPLIHVTVPVTTLLGIDDAPGELTGFGPIPAEMARRVAADPTGTWRRILTDPASGTLLDVGRITYRPPTALARHVTARDRTCRFPGCRQPARRCDLDHVQPFPTGPTAAANLLTLCRHHHRLKHEGRWQVRQTDDGAVTWTSPAGHSYTTHPPPLAEPVGAHAGAVGATSPDEAA